MPPSADDHRASRRSVLRAGGAALATGLSALSAGCTGLPPLGTQVRYGAVEAPDPDPPTYRDWLPAPSVLPDGGDSYQPWVHVPPPADAPSWARTSIGRSLVAYQTDYVGLDVDDAAFALTYGDATVLRGPVDRETVREVIPDTPYEPAGTEAGYDVYARPDVERVVAVGPDAVVFGNGPTAREYVRATVDAGRGDVARYYERDADLAALTDSAGTRRWAWLWPAGVGTSSTKDDLRTDTVGWATAFDHDDSGAYYVQTWVFPPGYDPTVGAVKESHKAEQRVGRADPSAARAVDVTVEGRVAAVEMHLTWDAIEEVAGDHTLVAPHVTWRASVSPDADRLTIHHVAGDPVRTDWLWVEGAGSETDGPVAATADVGDRLDPGEELVVATADAEPGATVRLVYRVPDGNASTTLFDYDLL